MLRNGDVEILLGAGLFHQLVRLLLDKDLQIHIPQLRSLDFRFNRISFCLFLIDKFRILIRDTLRSHIADGHSGGKLSLVEQEGNLHIKGIPVHHTGHKDGKAALLPAERALKARLQRLLVHRIAEFLQRPDRLLRLPLEQVNFRRGIGLAEQIIEISGRFIRRVKSIDAGIIKISRPVPFPVQIKHRNRCDRRDQNHTHQNKTLQYLIHFRLPFSAALFRKSVFRRVPKDRRSSRTHVCRTPLPRGTDSSQ